MDYERGRTAMRWLLIGLVVGMLISSGRASAGPDERDLRDIARNTDRIASALEKGCK